MYFLVFILALEEELLIDPPRKGENVLLVISNPQSLIKYSHHMPAVTLVRRRCSTGHQSCVVFAYRVQASLYLFELKLSSLVSRMGVAIQLFVAFAV